MEDSESDMQVS